MPLKKRGHAADLPMMARLARRSLLALSVLVAVLVPARAALAFTDVPTSYWDYGSIKDVAIDRAWMQDYSDGTFRPRTQETREFLARTLVTIYAPTQPVDTSITFSDLPSSSSFYRYADIAVKNGWMATWPGNAFHPLDSIRTSSFDKAIILAMGLSGPANGLANIHADDGYHYTVSPMFPYMELAHVLGLHFNHPQSAEWMELEPKDPITRDEVAYSIDQAVKLPSWERADASAFTNISLNTHNPDVPAQEAKRQVTQFALQYVGYPYIWGGEWYARTPAGYCCGAQVKGGFDCSGFAWWVLQLAGEDGFNNAAMRGYGGWAIPQRTSFDMAHATSVKISFADLRTGDLMFFADYGGTSWRDADHVGIYLGNGWMIHSTGSTAGVAIENVTSGWWPDHFLWGRRFLPN